MEECRNMPLIGEKLPEMEVVTTKGVKKLPEDYKGKWLVLFSHPADFTPVCTTEFVAFQQRYEKFKELNTELLGLSIDQVFAHIKWEEWIEEKLNVKIEFPIIADPKGDVAKKLGMLQETASKTNTVRAVFIVDNKGIIRAILYYPLELGRNIDEILRMIKGLQTIDKHGVALPHKWPENELVGDHAIIPPATSVQEKEERLKAAEKGEIECFDWWFCHKKIS
ncbi:MAG: peroxiredoxin [Candidatus Nanohaloarchaeota archaeon]|nr:peroxiredoxin [Candidatus Nanohaloarchaeota archaeon]